MEAPVTSGGGQKLEEFRVGENTRGTGIAGSSISLSKGIGRLRKEMRR